MDLSLIIPLFNEAKNIEQLLKMIAESTLLAKGLREVILINNASLDETGSLLDQLSPLYPWAKVIHLKENLNYGGGVFEGLKYANGEFVGYIPGDLQVSAQDVLKVWNEILSQTLTSENRKILAKGRRVIRLDGYQTRFVSRVYTLLSNSILNLEIRDVNGLPKIFHRSLLPFLPKEMMRTFVFDAQLLHIARQQNWRIFEVPVTFHARRHGVSSWSKKRLSTYKTTFNQLRQIRHL